MVDIQKTGRVGEPRPVEQVPERRPEEAPRPARTTGYSPAAPSLDNLNRGAGTPGVGGRLFSAPTAASALRQFNPAGIALVGRVDKAPLEASVADRGRLFSQLEKAVS